MADKTDPALRDELLREPAVHTAMKSAAGKLDDPAVQSAIVEARKTQLYAIEVPAEEGPDPRRRAELVAECINSLMDDDGQLD